MDAYWSFYLPVAGHSLNIFMLLGFGGAVGFLSGLTGVGGGFLMTPILIMAGIPPTIAAASDSNQIVAATTSGSYTHYRLGNVDVKMGSILLIGGVLGGTVGVQIIKFLRSFGEADFFIKATYVVMLSLVGTYMLIESVRSRKNAREGADNTAADRPPTRFRQLMSALPWQVHFAKSNVTLSPVLPLCVGGFVGMLAAIMGLGGGFIMVPLMCYVLEMPMHVVVGTNLFQEVFVCAGVTVMQSASNHTVDIILAILLLLGSSIGAQLGARASHRLKPDNLKTLLACIVLAVMVKILLGLILTPHYMLDFKGGE
ncbi:sulfite exporter TauE/SafE family protein [Desulfopila sp. IMCC35006]|uniref:sulfite exporter TauE/SafE family protein n=1 Tax=Desulfopila sp. IMCC35006 TaxID=2569542 RepID=UPI0010AB7013|nr:sulfite exporter TauE/SafE family protein [Desulfopila sp. IMCC35006]TKB23680.1 sulfite exporter TauE/SafE family protein [Desulfopila sp. IMCC35006]